MKCNNTTWLAQKQGTLAWAEGSVNADLLLPETYSDMALHGTALYHEDILSEDQILLLTSFCTQISPREWTITVSSLLIGSPGPNRQ